MTRAPGNVMSRSLKTRGGHRPPSGSRGRRVTWSRWWPRVVAAAVGLAIVSARPPALGKAPPTPNDPSFPAYVMARIDDLYRGDKSHGVLEMQVKTKHWTRSLSMESWSLGKDYSLVRILKPRKERGTATLKAKRQLFTYLSKTGRTIKITSGMMGASWMGSHFTNDDLMRESRLSDDYHIKLTGRGDHQGTPVYRFTLTPKPQAAVPWGRQEVTVRQQDLLPVSQRFFDEDGKPARSLEFSHFQKISGRILPTQMLMRPLAGSSAGEQTRLTVKQLDFGVSLTESFFTLRKLKSM